MTSQASALSTPEEYGLCRAITETAAKFPEAIALAAPGRESLTYDGLADRLGEVTEHLRQLGCCRGRRLALLMPTGPDAIVASLALTSCATSLPLNPGLRAAELELKLRQLRADGVLVGADAGAEALAAASSCGLPVIRLSSDPGVAVGDFRIDGEPLPAREDRSAGSSAPALVMQTSGTTGRPKNVPLTHANLLASAASIRTSMSLSAEDRFLCAAQPHRIVGVALVLASLWAGSTVSCAPYYGAAFLDWIESFQPTWFWLTPTMLQELLPLARRRTASLRQGSLRFIRCGSSALPEALLAEAEDLFGVPLIETYGMTEAANQITCNPLPPGRRRVGAAGVPTGPEVRVADGTGARVAAGATGEILVRGPSVFAGYEEDYEANRAAFRDGWFRTGDLGHFDVNGFLYVTGRLKEIINRGGEKIAPREVEEALMAHSSVAEAVVFAIPHPRLGEDVGAAAVLRSGEAASEQDLREAVARRLAAFKAPARVWILPEIPKGPGGKLQRVGFAERMGLLGVAPAKPVRRARKVSPATLLEEQLAAMWKSVLKTEEIGIHDDFYDLGGDSFAVNLLLTRVQARFNVGNRLLDRIAFMDVPTIAKQALLISEGMNSTPADPALPDLLVLVQPDGHGAPLFLLPGAGEQPADLLQLTRHLGVDRPIYGFRNPIPPEERGLYTIEDVAGELAAAITTVAPGGPYHLVGHCFGGVLAFETARRLSQAGERIGLLALIDTPTPGYPRLTPYSRLFWSELGRRLARLFRGRFADQLRQLASDAASLGRHLKRRIDARLARSVVRAGLDRGSQPMAHVFEANVRAQRMYVPKPYDGSIVHFLAIKRNRAGEALDERLGWGEVVRGSCELKWFDAEHLSILEEPVVPDVAEELRRLLARAE
jgi:acyl-CoA synthetase (AMP-forming)/AMP-acid ligase II/thioesterase domain-containing protein